MTDISKKSKKSSGCLILICGFLAWIAILGIFLATVTVKNRRDISATIGEKLFYPIFAQMVNKDKNLSNPNFFSNDYFHLLEEVKLYGLNKKNLNSITNILIFTQDKKITKSELESFSNSVWKSEIQ